MESHFQDRFLGDVWCGIIQDSLICPFIIEERLGATHYLFYMENDFPTLLYDSSLNVLR